MLSMHHPFRYPTYMPPVVRQLDIKGEELNELLWIGPSKVPRLILPVKYSHTVYTCQSWRSAARSGSQEMISAYLLWFYLNYTRGSQRKKRFSRECRLLMKEIFSRKTVACGSTLSNGRHATEISPMLQLKSCSKYAVESLNGM
jgi:hypothetical protein